MSFTIREIYCKTVEEELIAERLMQISKICTLQEIEEFLDAKKKEKNIQHVFIDD